MRPADCREPHNSHDPETREEKEEEPRIVQLNRPTLKRVRTRPLLEHDRVRGVADSCSRDEYICWDGAMSCVSYTAAASSGLSQPDAR